MIVVEQAVGGGEEDSEGERRRETKDARTLVCRCSHASLFIVAAAVLPVSAIAGIMDWGSGVGGPIGRHNGMAGSDTYGATGARTDG